MHIFRWNVLRWLQFCFNSLQTGKHMCTKKMAVVKDPYGLHGSGVSIPFKRESTCAHGDQGEYVNHQNDTSFQFPSNGKAHVHSFPKNSGASSNNAPMFQFPSNGKAHVHVLKVKGAVKFRIPVRVTHVCTL